jgi:hypothetical protein
MSETYRIHVFGKQTCEKCKVLNQRLDKLLEDSEWTEFRKVYHDVETEEGVIAFCEAECINPQRIPALLVLKQEPESDRFRPILNRTPGRNDDICGKSRLYQYLGLQTDYSGAGGGVISPRMIKACLSEAKAG